MILKILKFQDAESNPEGKPADWPAAVKEVAQGESAAAPWILMSTRQYHEYLQGLSSWPERFRPAGFADLRKHRDALIAASDWTQLADSPLSAAAKAAWKAYRQALRDLPNSLAENEWNGVSPVIWPEKPE